MSTSDKTKLCSSGMSNTSRTTTFVITAHLLGTDDEGASSLCNAFLNTFSNLRSGIFRCLLGVGANGTFISRVPQFFLLSCLALPCLVCV
ncbi:uncharacterized protein SKDI_06G1050 [Saccharomyces kudriavzevii IFO 1802]|uniref:Uncharacterized protein n=1 Tax=Saccharomyces kudriavzevii (strain ATCC MYA-4449 / AS 2.2408 / CBS 8840 / NBRC 1802 / NCYC 2889) TaxID=226230 RepID=A0AA35JGE5_SACK1|nr:uncharacterized protein SKDI_06G1050 [Saccharomyces kudriavzevii IFO 1802]CAI4061113.1 hypothetical protein SKDI_06G1050 [Saccharomyces kudriavzevii IFO 1802]